MALEAAGPESEDRLIGWLRRLGNRSKNKSPIGDDAAFLNLGGDWAVTVDSQIEGIHFPAGLDPALVARRLLAVNLSDLAATGALPVWAFLSLAVPPGFPARRFFQAFVRATQSAGVTLAGGDLARSPQGLVATLTLLGRRPSGGRWLKRSAARAGDLLYLGGTIGESALGQRLLARGAGMDARGRVTLPNDLGIPPALARAARNAIRRHVEPQPQLALGQALGRAKRAAALDVSDGLARDLHRLCNESKVGAEIDAAALPLAPRFAELCAAVGENPLDLALSGGEDYVLLFSLPMRNVPPSEFPCTPIGTITAGRAVRLRIDGANRKLPPLGWDHLS
ncbi:MAG TPA: thiamine-phosphate kinase [Thermoanaerobaculia bacterium]|jgi:thiamine-monophosphate kinase|nr:thiamine-phosphate kinase [Thermoanaerobaculia bacterium]